MASSRPRIFWDVLEDSDKLWSKGWLPDSDTLRWSLSAAIRVEGLREGWGPCHAAAESATIIHSYVGETEDGEWVECTTDGLTLDGEIVGPAPATLAILAVESE